MGSVLDTLRLVPELDVSQIQSSCCGMAGAFGYGHDTYAVSMKMAELDLLPAVRKADKDVLVVADGGQPTTSHHPNYLLGNKNVLFRFGLHSPITFNVSKDGQA